MSYYGAWTARRRPSDRWRAEGIGAVRAAIAAGAEVPTLFVRRGHGQSGVAPTDTVTRFT